MRNRFGNFNGLLGIVKAYAAEICRDEHQALGLSVFNTIWRVGLIIGLAIGGFLAQPTDKYPKIFSKNICLEDAHIFYHVFVSQSLHL